MSDTERFEFLRPDGTASGPVRLVAVLAAAARRVVVGKGPFNVLRDPGYDHPGLSKGAVVRMLRGMLPKIARGDHVVVRAADGSKAFEVHRTGDATLLDNPLRDVAGLQPLREDEGVDYSTTRDSPLYAIGPGEVITYRTVTGWPGAGGVRNGAYIAVRFTADAGPELDKKAYYYAENITLNPALHAGSAVDKDTVLATLHPGFANCELGWDSGQPGYDTPLANTPAGGGYTEGERCALGVNFDGLMVALGAPQGLSEGRPIGGRVPAGFPSNWKAVV